MSSKNVFNLFIISIKNVLFFLSFLLVFLSISNFFSVNLLAAKMQLEPVNHTFTIGQGCSQYVDLYIDSTGESSNASDGEIRFNSQEIEVKSVKAGDAYEIFNVASIDNTNGVVKFYGFTTTVSNLLTSKKKFATLNYVPKVGVTFSNFQIYFTKIGDTYDSNVADTETSIDLLKSVSNTSHFYKEGICQSDIPKIDYLLPKPYSRNVSIDTNIDIKIFSDLVDIDINTLEIIIDGIKYTLDSQELSFTGTKKEYFVKIDPKNSFGYDKDIKVFTKVKNIKGDLAESEMIFSTKYVCDIKEDTNISENIIKKDIVNQNLPIVGSFTGDILNQEKIINIFNEIIKTYNYSTFWALVLLLLILTIILLLLDFFKRKITGNIKELVNEVIDLDLVSYKVYVFDNNLQKIVKSTKVNHFGDYILRLDPGNYKIYALSNDETDKEIKLEDENLITKNVSIPAFASVELFNSLEKKYIPVRFENIIDFEEQKKDNYFTTSRLKIFIWRLILASIYSFKSLLNGIVLLGIILSFISLTQDYSITNLVLSGFFVLVFLIKLFLPYLIDFISFLKKDFRQIDVLKNKKK